MPRTPTCSDYLVAKKYKTLHPYPDPHINPLRQTT